MTLGYSHVIRNLASSDLHLTRRDSQCEKVSYVILIIPLLNGEVSSIQLYVIKLVSDLRQVVGVHRLLWTIVESAN